MTSARFHPASWLARPLLLVGLLCLAALTLLDQGASRMYAAPWSNCYWLMIALPPLLLLLRVAAPGTFNVPANPWLGWLATAVVALIAAAVFSPYRGPSLLWSALPLTGMITFLLVYDWLQAEPKNSDRLVNFQTVAASVVMLASSGYWLVDLTQRTREQIFSTTLFESRNAHPLGHANYTAGLALLSLPWLVRATLKTRGALRLGATIATALALLALFMSGSRGGMLGLAALGLGALLHRKLGWKKFFLFAGGAIAIAGLLALANPRIRALTSPQAADAEPNLSTVQRTAMLEAGILMALERPVFGWGPGSTPLVFPRFRQDLEGGAENILQLHNAPIEILAGTGSAGLLAGAAFLVLAFLSRSRAPIAALTLAGYAVFSLTDYQLDVPVFVFALATLAAQLASSRPAPASERMKRGVIVATLAIVALIAGLGRRDPTPELNAEALTLAVNPAQLTRAISLLNQSLAYNADQEIAHFNLGWLLVVSDPPSAEQHFREAMRLVPDKGGVYFGIGLARLNQGNREGAARALALECLNDPQFLASPWWTVPAIAAERGATAAIFARLTAQAADTRLTNGWANRQADLLASLAPRLGHLSPGAEKSYRRARLGYPVLMRNQDFAPPVDLYDVREDPRFAASVTFPLPRKGWLPSPLLRKLLDDTLPKE